MTDDHELDRAICRRIVADGLALGVRRFITDIEVASPQMDRPTYEYFGELGLCALTRARISHACS